MKANYNVTGEERKALVAKISELIGEPSKYQYMPTCAYQVGAITVDKEGSLICEDTELFHRIMEQLKTAGFEAASIDAEPEETTEATPEERETMNLSIQVPTMNGDEVSRLEQLIASKESLIKKAIGAEALPVEDGEEKLTFPWFHTEADPDEVKAYTDLVTALCRMAKEGKRVTGKDHPVENEKYAFRCFLLRLGFIGEEYKTSRKILLKNFSGSSAFKNGGASHETSEQ